MEQDSRYVNMPRMVSVWRSEIVLLRMRVEDVEKNIAFSNGWESYAVNTKVDAGVTRTRGNPVS